MAVAVFVGGAVLGAAFGEVFAVLHDTVKNVGSKVLMFKSVLKSLESNLDLLLPVVEEISQLNRELGRPEEEIKSLMEDMKKAEELIRTCSATSGWNDKFQAHHSKQLTELDKAIVKFCQVYMPAQIKRDTLQILKDTSQISQILGNTTQILEDTSQISQMIWEEIKAIREENKLKKEKVQSPITPILKDKSSQILGNTSQISEDKSSQISGDTSQISEDKSSQISGDTSQISGDTSQISPMIWEEIKAFREENKLKGKVHILITPCRQCGNTPSLEIQGHYLPIKDLGTVFFTYRQIIAATNNFYNANKLGEGGFGSVYKGILSDGTIIAVKKLSSNSYLDQRRLELTNEVGMISGLRHPNVIRLHGCCIEAKQYLLVYEYMENNSLAKALFGSVYGQLKLDWPERQKICLGIARGLAYLHTLKIVHRDIKPHNVLLDRDLNPKISDFGSAKLQEEENDFISEVVGTKGYIAPEYASLGQLSHQADVYGFGVVALEIVSGRSIVTFQPKGYYQFSLLEWAKDLQQEGNLMKLVDPKLKPGFHKEEALRMIKVALLCTNPSPALRPPMNVIVGVLEGWKVVDELARDPSVYGNESNFEALSDQFDSTIIPSLVETQSLNQTSNATRIGSSSTSAHYLYSESGSSEREELQMRERERGAEKGERKMK